MQKERMSDSLAKPKVLVADDERVIADTLSIILNQAGLMPLPFTAAKKQWRRRSR